jgi:preprotein translocase subunit SecE
MKLNENRLVNYVISAKAELKKVAWPTKKEATRHTLIVIGVSLFGAAFLGLLDYLFSRVLSIIL